MSSPIVALCFDHRACGKSAEDTKPPLAGNLGGHKVEVKQPFLSRIAGLFASIGAAIRTLKTFFIRPAEPMVARSGNHAFRSKQDVTDAQLRKRLDAPNAEESSLVETMIVEAETVESTTLSTSENTLANTDVKLCENLNSRSKQDVTDAQLRKRLDALNAAESSLVETMIVKAEIVEPTTLSPSENTLANTHVKLCENLNSRSEQDVMYAQLREKLDALKIENNPETYISELTKVGKLYQDFVRLCEEKGTRKYQKAIKEVETGLKIGKDQADHHLAMLRNTPASGCFNEVVKRNVLKRQWDNLVRLYEVMEWKPHSKIMGEVKEIFCGRYEAMLHTQRTYSLFNYAQLLSTALAGEKEDLLIHLDKFKQHVEIFEMHGILDCLYFVGYLKGERVEWSEFLDSDYLVTMCWNGLGQDANDKDGVSEDWDIRDYVDGETGGLNEETLESMARTLNTATVQWNHKKEADLLLGGINEVLDVYKKRHS